METQEAYDYGYDNGYGIGRENISDLLVMDEEAYILACASYESDEFRQYSPFEFFAHDVNEEDNSDELWDAYDNGVMQGIQDAVKDYQAELAQ